MADEFEADVESLGVDLKLPYRNEIISVNINFYDAHNKVVLVRDEIRRLLDEHGFIHMQLQDLRVMVVTLEGAVRDVDLDSSTIDCADDFTHGCIHIQTR